MTPQLSEVFTVESSQYYQALFTFAEQSLWIQSCGSTNKLQVTSRGFVDKVVSTILRPVFEMWHFLGFLFFMWIQVPITFSIYICFLV